MLIHIGGNEFVSLNKCELLLNLSTIDEDSKKLIFSALPKIEKTSEYKSAILTTDGKWTGSTLSSEALAQRGICNPFETASFVKNLCNKN